jgi:AraC family transcriptional regulator, transcriptional activator of pobA
MLRALPLFHLYGEPLDNQAFDFIHVETIASRSSIHGWRIRPHRHRTLSQILFIECGGGDMDFQATRLKFSAPVVILVPATVAHGFRFEDGGVLSFTKDAALGFAQGAARHFRLSVCLLNNRSFRFVTRQNARACRRYSRTF